MADMDKVVIGLVGLSESSIDMGKQGYCHFPIGEPDPAYLGGKVWERVKVTAIKNIRAHYEVLVVDNRRAVKEHTLESPLINEKTVTSNNDNIKTSTTEKIDLIETTGYNKITGFVFADQNLTIYVDQSFNQTHWDVVSTIPYVGNSTGGAISVEIIAPYARVRFDNSSGTDTSKCRKIIRLSAGA